MNKHSQPTELKTIQFFGIVRGRLEIQNGDGEPEVRWWICGDALNCIEKSNGNTYISDNFNLLEHFPPIFDYYLGQKMEMAADIPLFQVVKVPVSVCQYLTMGIACRRASLDTHAYIF